MGLLLVYRISVLMGSHFDTFTYATKAAVITKAVANNHLGPLCKLLTRYFPIALKIA